MRMTAATKYQLIEGSSLKVSTFMPKKPTIKVNGRKMNVIQLSRHMESPSCNDCRESLIPTDLYIRSLRLFVGCTKSSLMV